VEEDGEEEVEELVLDGEEVEAEREVEAEVETIGLSCTLLASRPGLRSLSSARRSDLLEFPFILLTRTPSSKNSRVG
jgi:hypothetical protein